MTSEQISALIEEVSKAPLAPKERASLLASMLQAYHLAKIAEEITAIRTRETLFNRVRNFINRTFSRKG